MQRGPIFGGRRSIRLKGYDYSSQGAYFITLVTKNRQCLFGEIVETEMVLNEAGRIANRCWSAIPDHFPNVSLDEYVIMPNHIHGILVFGPDVTATDQSALGAKTVGAKNFSPQLGNPSKFSPYRGDFPIFSPWDNHRPDRKAPFRSPSRTVGSVVRGFKIGVTKWLRRNTDVYTVWQRNYYEHIVRGDDDLYRIRQYIANNPMKWSLDNENPDTAKS